MTGEKEYFLLPGESIELYKDLREVLAYLEIPEIYRVAFKEENNEQLLDTRG